jgi:hypothetical protein
MYYTHSNRNSGLFLGLGILYTCTGMEWTSFFFFKTLPVHAGASVAGP